MLERIWEYPMRRLVGEALNIRLNTTNLTLAQVADTLSWRNITLDEIFGMPEMDGWIYSDGPSYVCSSFVAGVYKAGGLFGANASLI